MKKVINDPQRVVIEALEGMAAAHPDLIRVSLEPKFVYRADAPRQGKVAVISGGGSGHEPMHGGFVGRGMLDAACPGEVFTSPTPDQMYEAAKKVHGGSGVLLIVKNYAGDVMNFDLAADLLRADGIAVESVLIADDVAVESSLYSQGRRGTGTTVLAEKILGAAAERGYSLEQLAALGRRIADNGRSMGLALTSCTVPHVGKPTFELGPDEVEIGIGIHGEPGRFREPLRPADELVERLMGPILDDLPFQSGDRVICLVNSMGGTPLLELYIAYRKVAAMCQERGITIARNLVGAYITSLEMAGISITLLRADDEMLMLWDDPVLTPALRWGA